jgi:hypothetical protein
MREGHTRSLSSKVVSSREGILASGSSYLQRLLARLEQWHGFHEETVLLSSPVTVAGPLRLDRIPLSRCDYAPQFYSIYPAKSIKKPRQIGLDLQYYKVLY